MDEDEDDDFYAPEETSKPAVTQHAIDPVSKLNTNGHDAEEEEEGEELEEEESDSASTILFCERLLKLTRGLAGYRYYHRAQRRSTSPTTVCGPRSYARSHLNNSRSARQKESKPPTLSKSERRGSVDPVASATPVKAESTVRETRETSVRAGSTYPAIKASDIDVNDKPIHEPSGKPITEVDIDAGRTSIPATDPSTDRVQQTWVRTISHGVGLGQT